LEIVNANRLVPVRKQLIDNSNPREILDIILLFVKLELRYPATKHINKTPRFSNGTPNLSEIKGQAIPKSPSGSPRLMKARKDINMSILSLTEVFIN